MPFLVPRQSAVPVPHCMVFDHNFASARRCQTVYWQGGPLQKQMMFSENTHADPRRIPHQGMPGHEHHLMQPGRGSHVGSTHGNDGMLGQPAYQAGLHNNSPALMNGMSRPADRPMANTAAVLPASISHALEEGPRRKVGCASVVPCLSVWCRGQCPAGLPPKPVECIMLLYLSM